MDCTEDTTTYFIKAISQVDGSVFECRKAVGMRNAKLSARSLFWRVWDFATVYVYGPDGVDGYVTPEWEYKRLSK